jgi:hypothetical protein
MSLNELRDKVGEINKRNGFHEAPFNLGEKLMLINTELSECLEADRIGHHSDIPTFEKRLQELNGSMNPNLLEAGSPEEMTQRKEHFKTVFKRYIKEGVEAEVIDALIRLFDLCYIMNIDMDTLFDLITKNNSLREYKHGKKY